MKKRLVATAALVAALVLSGCSANGSDANGNDASANDANDANTGANPSTSVSECAGIEVVVDFGALNEPAVQHCLDTDIAVTAAQAFIDTGVELSESQAFAGAICRVDGHPAESVALEYDGETYTEDCVNMGPVWAYWGLFIDTGEGWGYAQEGAASQHVEPGEAIAFAWQFGDTTEPRLPAV